MINAIHLQLARKYVWNVLIAIDQLMNALFGGDPDETISSRMGKWARDNYHVACDNRLVLWAVLNWIVNKFERDHFKKSIDDSEGKDSVLK
jgi:hypothetical protein